MNEKIPFSLLYENMQAILDKPKLYSVKVTCFSAGGLGACAYGQSITIAELVRCWQHKEYQIQCPNCGETAYITQWAGHVNGGGYWEINAYCPHCGESHHFPRASSPVTHHKIHWTKMRNILQEEKNAIKNETDNKMENNQDNNFADNGNQKTNNPVDTEKMTITLLNGRTLPCYPRVETAPSVDNTTKLDTTGQYLCVGRKKTVEPLTSPEQERAKKFFTDHAFFFLDHREQIFSDSRMFLAPVPVQNAIAYTGASGFHRPTLGVYIEWWMTCIPAIIGRYRKNAWLVYHIAGSPLSGRNSCGIVNPQGECRSESLPGPFSTIWRSFVEVNTRYDEAKERYEAYSLEDVVALLEANDQGDSLTERMVYILQKENIKLRQEIQEIEKNKAQKVGEMEKMRLALLKEYIESRRDVFEAWYADYCKKEEEGKRELDDLKLQQKQLKQQLRTGEITNKFHQQQLTPLKNRISNVEFRLSNMGVISLSHIVPETYRKYLSPKDVISFLNEKSQNNTLEME